MHRYNRSFYDTMMAGSLRSARAVVPLLFEAARPQTVLDVGCGEGLWLRVASEHGAARVIGIDGDYVSTAMLQIPSDSFISHDLATSFPQPQRADLALSLEVAEHLSAARAEPLVDFLTQSADIVFFGAAIPRQGGTDHINEQWQSHWAEKFQRRGYQVSTWIRDRIWDNADVAVWYRQNSLLYIREGHRVPQGLCAVRPSETLLDVVHPDLYSAKMRRYSFAEASLGRLQSAVNNIRSRISQ